MTLTVIFKKTRFFDPKSFSIFAILTLLYSDFGLFQSVSTAFFKQTGPAEQHPHRGQRALAPHGVLENHLALAGGQERHPIDKC